MYKAAEDLKMLKNIIIYIILIAAGFAFSVLYYAWFSWFLFIAIICIPIASLLISLPFMLQTAIRGINAFCDTSLKLFDPFHIGIRGRNGKALICPFLKVKFKAVNEFADTKRKIVLKYSGRISRPVIVSTPEMGINCGNIEISAQYGRVYDFTGIFFLPVRLKFKGSAPVMPTPERPSILPGDSASIIIGYNPKNGGFSDDYELRQYRVGDSLKAIHWKLSSSRDDLIVKDPSEPIYKRLVIKLVLSDEAEENDFILARFLYVAQTLLAGGRSFYAFEPRGGSLEKIKSDKELESFLLSVYSPSGFAAEELFKDAAVYSILPEREEVSEQ